MKGGGRFLAAMRGAFQPDRLAIVIRRPVTLYDAQGKPVYAPKIGEAVNVHAPRKFTNNAA
jgi:hypothetical protein